MSEPTPKDFLGKLVFTLDPEKLDESVREVASKLRQTVDTTRYSKVRLSYKGKPLMADIPLGLFVAGEAASLWWAGPLRVILVNLGIGSLIDVELRHDADEVLRKGQELFLEGEVDEAEEAYRKAREPKERLECLREMFRTIPKHKGTEHLQADIKTRIKQLSEELAGPRKGGRRSGLAERAFQ